MLNELTFEFFRDLSKGHVLLHGCYGHTLHMTSKLHQLGYAVLYMGQVFVMCERKNKIIA